MRGRWGWGVEEVVSQLVVGVCGVMVIGLWGFVVVCLEVWLVGQVSLLGLFFWWCMVCVGVGFRCIGVGVAVVEWWWAVVGSCSVVGKGVVVLETLVGCLVGSRVCCEAGIF